MEGKALSTTRDGFYVLTRDSSESQGRQEKVSIAEKRARTGILPFLYKKETDRFRYLGGW